MIEVEFSRHSIVLSGYGFQLLIYKLLMRSSCCLMRICAEKVLHLIR